MDKRVINFISEKTGISTSEIHEDTVLRDLGLDSFGLLDIAMSIEEEFDITISDRKLGTIRTIRDIITILEGEE